MLRHIRSHQVHWFCRHCWQEMPHITLAKSSEAMRLVETATRQQRLLQSSLMTSDMGVG